MNHEKEQLSRNLDELREKIAEATHQGYDQEMLVTKAMDRFEQLLQDYTTLGHQIGVLSSSFEGIQPGQLETDFIIDVDLGAESLVGIRDSGHQRMLVIRPALQGYCERFRKQARELQDDAIALEDARDRLFQDVERLREDVARREMRFKIVSDQAEEAKSVGVQ
jgi:kinetochore protein NDC80